MSATTVLFLGRILENKENIFRREFVDPVSRSPARWDQNDERHVGDYHIIFVVESSMDKATSRRIGQANRQNAGTDVRGFFIFTNGRSIFSGGKSDH